MISSLYTPLDSFQEKGLSIVELVSFASIGTQNKVILNRNLNQPT